MLILYLSSHNAEVFVLSALQCAVPHNRALTPLECAVPKTRSSKSFRMRSYEKRWGEGYASAFLRPPLLPYLCFGLCMLRIDRSPEDAEFVGGGEHFKAAALERAHFHHFVDQAVEQSYINEFGFRPGDEEHTGATHVDAGGGGGGQRAMAQSNKLHAPGVAGARVFKDLFRLEIEEAHAHRAAAEDSFKVAFAPAAAETFFRVQRDHRVAAFPHAFPCGIPPKA